MRSPESLQMGSLWWHQSAEQANERGRPLSPFTQSLVLHRTQVLWLSLCVLYKVIVAIIYLTFTLSIMALRDV